MTKVFKAIIVDDEESARNVLSHLLHHFCPEIQVVQKCHDVISAVQAIDKHQPDVVFLDIEMPNFAGYEIISFFKEVNFEIIFITAYDQYAIKAFEISAVDYLLKPLEINRLRQSIEKLSQKIESNYLKEKFSILADSLKNNEAKKIIIPSPGGQKIIPINDIIAIEAQESYSFIYMKDGKKHTVSKNLKHFELTLSDNSIFFRVHKSWMINLKSISRFSKSKLEIELENNIIAKLSKYRKSEFEKALQLN